MHSSFPWASHPFSVPQDENLLEPVVLIKFEGKYLFGLAQDPFFGRGSSRTVVLLRKFIVEKIISSALAREYDTRGKCQIDSFSLSLTI